MNNINARNITNLYFPEDVKVITLDNYFDCAKRDFDKAVANMEESEYKKLCLVKVEGLNPVLIDPENSKFRYSDYQVGVCFMNSLKDNQVYKITSTITQDVRIADIYSTHLSHIISNTLSYRTNVGWGVLPMTPGVFCIAPNQTIDIFMEKKRNNG